MQVIFHKRKKDQNQTAVNIVNFCSTGGHILKPAGLISFEHPSSGQREEMQGSARSHVSLGKRETIEFHFVVIKPCVFARLLDPKKKTTHRCGHFFSAADVEYHVNARLGKYAGCCGADFKYLVQQRGQIPICHFSTSAVAVVERPNGVSILEDYINWLK